MEDMIVLLRNAGFEYDEGDSRRRAGGGGWLSYHKVDDDSVVDLYPEDGEWWGYAHEVTHLEQRVGKDAASLGRWLAATYGRKERREVG